MEGRFGDLSTRSGPIRPEGPQAAHLSVTQDGPHPGKPGCGPSAVPPPVVRERRRSVLGGGARGSQAVTRVSPYVDRISLTGWNQVCPPLEQLPEPPEVTPCAWSPLTNEPPESPGSAQTLVPVIS